MANLIWNLKRDAERRFRTGHPWVFSNELMQSPRSVEAGSLVDLFDSQNRFLARGYGHPNSLISFRKLSEQAGEAIDAEFFVRRLKSAWNLRVQLGLKDYSFRWCFAEGDGLPGLIIDRFVLVDPTTLAVAGQALVVQASTAGMDRQLNVLLSVLPEIASETSGGLKTSIVVANDTKSRVLEGLVVENKKRVSLAGEKALAESYDLSQAMIRNQPCSSRLSQVDFHVDLIGGQKTGFFLDQRQNVQLLAEILSPRLNALKEEGRKLRILDLCCYVGQWSTQIAALARSQGVACEATLVDASATALALAEKNVAAQGAEVRAFKADVLEQLGAFATGGFDVVICDPPAFIKKKKDLAVGQAAYQKLNRLSMQKVAAQGIFVSCSCSGLLTDEDFRSVLVRAMDRASRWRWLLRGSHSVDHPQRPDFPQGSYLKSWFSIRQDGVIP